MKLPEWLAVFGRELHKGKPVVQGSVIEGLNGVLQSYILETEFNHPNALNPDAKDVEHFRPAVTIGMQGGNMRYVMNLKRDVALDLYLQLHRIFGK